MAFQKLMTVLVVKPTMLYGTQEIDDRCSEKKTVWLHGTQKSIRVDFCVRGDKTNAMWLYGIEKPKTLAVMKPVWLYVAQKTDDRCSKKLCGWVVLNKSTNVCGDKTNEALLYKKLMTFALIKVVWFRGTQKAPTVAVIKSVWLCGTQEFED